MVASMRQLTGRHLVDRLHHLVRQRQLHFIGDALLVTLFEVRNAFGAVRTKSRGQFHEHFDCDGWSRINSKSRSLADDLPCLLLLVLLLLGGDNRMCRDKAEDLLEVRFEFSDSLLVTITEGGPASAKLGDGTILVGA